MKNPINIKENFPDDFKDVLIYTGRKWVIGYRIKNIFYLAYTPHIICATHWMPLPDSPLSEG